MKILETNYRKDLTLPKSVYIVVVDKEYIYSALANNLPSNGALPSAVLPYRCPALDRLTGLSFADSRGNQRRYIWTTESNCHGSVLDDLETQDELSAHDKQHLDMPYNGIGRYVETLAHGEKAESDSPLPLVASNTVTCRRRYTGRGRSDSFSRGRSVSNSSNQGSEVIDKMYKQNKGGK